MKLFTNIALSTWIALIVATLAEGLEGTYQIRHPTTNDDMANDKRQLFSPSTTLTTLFGRAKCRIELRACRRALKGQTPDLDAWEVRASQLSASGGNDTSSKVVQMLQEVIVKARDVNMTAITQALKTPNFDSADKDALLTKAKTIRSEARALLKTSSALTVERVPEWIEKTQAVLNATSAFTEQVYRQLDPIFVGLLILFSPFIALYALIFAVPILYYILVIVNCDCPEGSNCQPSCFLKFIWLTPVIIVGLILEFVRYAISQMVKYIKGLFSDQPRLSAKSDDTCFDNLLSCRYDRMLDSIIRQPLDLMEKRG